MNDPVPMDIFITAITAPTPSKSYIETSCTAGFDRNGNWIRVYPVPLRKLSRNQSYRKYQWVRFDTFPPSGDIRPESRKCNHDSIEIISDVISSWDERKKICMGKGQKIYTDFDELLSEANCRPIKTSLAVFKPTQILDCFATDTNEEEIRNILEKQKDIMHKSQPELNFSDDDRAFIQADPPRISLKYRFTDSTGKAHTLSVLDWEAYMLYRSVRQRGGSHEKARSDTIAKYKSFIDDKDIHFFLGTRKDDHLKGFRQPFSIIGVFYPPKPKEPIDKKYGQNYFDFD